LENLVVDGRIILQRVFKKWDEEAWTGLIWYRIGTNGGGGACAGGEEHSGFLKFGP
jgi:hypothetical protein